MKINKAVLDWGSIWSQFDSWWVRETNSGFTVLSLQETRGGISAIVEKELHWAGHVKKSAVETKPPRTLKKSHRQKTTLRRSISKRRRA